MQVGLHNWFICVAPVNYICGNFKNWQNKKKWQISHIVQWPWFTFSHVLSYCNKKWLWNEGFLVSYSHWNLSKAASVMAQTTVSVYLRIYFSWTVLLLLLALTGNSVGASFLVHQVLPLLKLCGITKCLCNFLSVYEYLIVPVLWGKLFCTFPENFHVYVPSILQV